MTRDDDLEAKLGSIRSRGSRRGGKYLHRVLRAVALAGGRPRGGSSSRRSTFHGSQLGRGAPIGRLLSSRVRSVPTVSVSNSSSPPFGRRSPGGVDPYATFVA